ncbi:unnamed protein product, partial [Prorocentrum cordatum]
ADPPIARANHSYAYLSQHIPLRSTSKLLEDDARQLQDAERTGSAQQARAKRAQSTGRAATAAAAPRNDLNLTDMGKHAHMSDPSQSWHGGGGWDPQQSWDSWMSDPWPER